MQSCFDELTGESANPPGDDRDFSKRFERSGDVAALSTCQREHRFGSVNFIDFER
jgi:hypothetical protein